jgi:hypothetical protein
MQNRRATSSTRIVGFGYKYMRPTLPGLEPLQHLHELLVDRRIYFPRPNEYWRDDEFDCKPPIVVGSKEQIDAYVQEAGDKRKAAREQRDEVRRKATDLDWLKETWIRQANRYGVLSLSSSKCNPSLWRSYGAEGTGVCVELDLEVPYEARLLMWVPNHVEYREEPIPLNILDYCPFDTDSPEILRAKQSEFIRRTFRIKRLRYMVEEEMRVVWPLENPDQKLPVPPGILSAVYLGPRISAQDRERVLSWDFATPVYAAVEEASLLISGFERLR